MSDVFISYAREDRARIEALAAALEGEGFSIWWDRRIDAGAEFSKDIEEALKAAKAVIVAWSVAGNASTWVRDEASFARNAGTLLPIRLDASNPPLGFQQFHAFDFSNWSGDPGKEEFSTLVASLRRRIEGEAAQVEARTAPSRDGPLAGSLKRPALALGAAAAVVAALAGVFILKQRTKDPSSTSAPVEKAASASIAAEAVKNEGVGLAVLPFANFSSDPEQEFFADGLTEEILNWLGNVEGLRVPGRTTSFQFKGKAQDLRAIGETLGVGYVLEGSVRRSGDKLRITAQLIDAKAGDHLWSETYDRKLADIFDIQTDIARRVVTELLGKIPETGVANPAAVGDVDPRAHELYLEGQALWAQRQGERAFEKFRAAAAVDSRHALAHAYEAVVLANFVANGFAFPGVQNPDATMAAALAEAVRLRPQSADVLFAQGWAAEFADKNPYNPPDAAAVEFYRRAVRANPRHVEALHALARADQQLGQARIANLERILDIDPAHRAARFNLIDALIKSGEREKALSAARRWLSLSREASRAPTAVAGKRLGDLELMGEALFSDWEAAERDFDVRWLRATFLADLGSVEEARFLFAPEAKLDSNPAWRDEALISVAVLDGDAEAALAAAQSLHGLKTAPPYSDWWLGAALISAGQPERAYEVLLESQPDIAQRRARSFITPEELTAAQALALAGRRDEARALWREARAAFGAQRAADVGSEWAPMLARALISANLEEREAAVADFKNAYDAGFRYLRSYACDACVQDGFYAEDGIFAELVKIPEAAALLERIKTENARTLDEFNKRYGILDKVRAMMAAEGVVGAPAQ